jgi:RimJ/RimL family protein N-acetyltransferase
MSSSIFKSAGLTYRAIEDNDADRAFVYSLRLDTAAMANSSPKVMKPRNRKEFDEFTKHMIDDLLLGVFICLSDDSETPRKPIGFIVLMTVKGHEHHRKAAISVKIESEQRGKGYGSESIRWVLDWAFQNAGLHRVSIGCFSYNEGARKLYARLGFVCEGRDRESLWFRGEWYDLIHFGMLEGEWREQTGKA